MSILIYILIATSIVSLISLIGIFFLWMNDRVVEEAEELATRKGCF
jgi:hypothetical protein